MIELTRFIFVRHGESEANLENVFAGSYDAPLTQRGMAQAQCTARFLKDTPIDAAYASDLKRAFNTGEGIARPHGLSVQPNRRLREISAGQWEGIPFEQIARQWPQEYHNWMHCLHECRCPGGESVAELQERIHGALMHIAAENEGRTVLIATHATPIRVMKLIWLGLPLAFIASVPWVSNASVTMVDYEGGAWRVVLDGADEHLAALKTALPDNI